MLDVSIVLPFIIALALPMFLGYLTDWNKNVIMVSLALALTIMIWAGSIPEPVIIIPILMIGFVAYQTFFDGGEE